MPKFENFENFFLDSQLPMLLLTNGKKKFFNLAHMWSGEPKIDFGTKRRAKTLYPDF